jgi:hypothetical protein
MFLSSASQEWLPPDGATDYAIVLDRAKAVSPDLADMKPAIAPLRLLHQLSTGPSDYREVGQRFVEFKKDSENELYRTDHVAPDFSLVAALKLTLERKTPKNSANAKTLWRFQDWARAEAELSWKRTFGGL